MLLVTEHTDVQLRAARVAQLDGAVEALVLRGVIVLQACNKVK
jgi:hypothetical protein